ALVPQNERDDQRGSDLGRTEERRILADVANIERSATLEYLPRDAAFARETLTEIVRRRAHRRADLEKLAGVAECEQEAVLVGHRLADDPQETIGECLDVENRRDLAGEPLQDRELPAMRARRRRELLDERGRTGDL